MRVETETKVNLTSGGYNINPTNEISKEALVAFQEATNSLAGASYEPLILVGTQVVSGTNYKYIALISTITRNQKKKIVEMEIYKPITGKAMIKEGTTKELVSEATGLGAWKITALDEKIPSEVMTAADNYFSQIDGVGYKPLMYVAKQSVSGTNYMLYYKTTTVSPRQKYGLSSVVLYQDFSGNISTPSITPL